MKASSRGGSGHRSRPSQDFPFGFQSLTEGSRLLFCLLRTSWTLWWRTRSVKDDPRTFSVLVLYSLDHHKGPTDPEPLRHTYHLSPRVEGLRSSSLVSTCPTGSSLSSFLQTGVHPRTCRVWKSHTRLLLRSPTLLVRQGSVITAERETGLDLSVSPHPSRDFVADKGSLCSCGSPEGGRCPLTLVYKVKRSPRHTVPFELTVNLVLTSPLFNKSPINPTFLIGKFLLFHGRKRK